MCKREIDKEVDGREGYTERWMKRGTVRRRKGETGKRK